MRTRPASDGSSPRGERRARPRARVGALVLVLALVAGVGAMLVASTAQERQARADAAATDVVLRVSRLAGYRGAVTGVASGQAVVRLVFPSSLVSAADVELGWETGMAALSAAYPTARSYRVDLALTADETLASATGRGGSVRAAVADDSVASLRSALTFRVYANGDGLALPANAKSSSGREGDLDALNRAVGLVSVEGPAFPDGEGLAQAWADAFRAAEGVPAPSGGASDAVLFWSRRMTDALSRAQVEGGDELLAAVRGWVDSADVVTVRTWSAVTSAIADSRPVGRRVLKLTAAATREVERRSARVGGPGKYRASGVAVAALTAVSQLDATGSADATGVVGMTLARWGVAHEGQSALAWQPGDSTEAGSARYASAAMWRAYRSPEGRVFWLAEARPATAEAGGTAGDAAVALTETSLKGWGYRTFSVSLVDASDTSLVLAVFPPKDSQ